MKNAIKFDISQSCRCSLWAKRHNKSEKLFGYLKWDIWNIDLRNLKHFIFLTYKHIVCDIPRQVLISEKVLSEILNKLDMSFGYPKGCTGMLWCLASGTTMSAPFLTSAWTCTEQLFPSNVIFQGYINQLHFNSDNFHDRVYNLGIDPTYITKNHFPRHVKIFCVAYYFQRDFLPLQYSVELTLIVMVTTFWGMKCGHKFRWVQIRFTLWTSVYLKHFCFSIFNSMHNMHTLLVQ